MHVAARWPDAGPGRRGDQKSCAVNRTGNPEVPSRDPSAAGVPVGTLPPLAVPSRTETRDRGATGTMTIKMLRASDPARSKGSKPQPSAPGFSR